VSVGALAWLDGAQERTPTVPAIVPVRMRKGFLFMTRGSQAEMSVWGVNPESPM